MRLQEINHAGIRWININDPDQDMVVFLTKNFSFHPLDLEDILSKISYPKIDAYPDYLFIILQFPVFEEERQIYKRAEIDIFFGRDFLITINAGNLPSLQNFFDTCLTDELSRDKFMKNGGSRLLYEIMDAMADKMFPIINEKNEQIFRLEEEIFETSEYKDMIQEIMILKRNMINIRRILAPQRAVIMELGTKHKDLIAEGMEMYFGDTVDKKDKIINQLDTALAYVDVLEDANEALLTRSTNKVIKTLTVFSVLVLPANLVINYYGMNVLTPLQSSPHILFYINTFLVSSVGLLLLYFAKKRWL